MTLILADDGSPNEAPITELWAWLSTDDNGDGIIAAEILPGYLSPLVSAKRRVADKLEPLAKAATSPGSKGYKLVRFIRSDT